jgi:Trehalase
VGIAPPEGPQALAAMAAFRRSGLLGPAGVATTDAATGQQWDAPNAWPPLQDIVIEALENYGGEMDHPGCMYTCHSGVHVMMTPVAHRITSAAGTHTAACSGFLQPSCS